MLGAAASARLLLAQERQVTAGTTVRYRVLRDLLAVAELLDGVTPGPQDAPG